MFVENPTICSFQPQYVYRLFSRIIFSIRENIIFLPLSTKLRVVGFPHDTYCFYKRKVITKIAKQRMDGGPKSESCSVLSMEQKNAKITVRENYSEDKAFREQFLTLSVFLAIILWKNRTWLETINHIDAGE